MDPSLMMDTNFWLEISNEPWIGDFEGILVGNCDGEVLGRSDGFWLGGQKKHVSRSIRWVHGRVMCGFWYFGGRQVA